MLPLLILLMALPARSYGGNPGMKLVLADKALQYAQSRGSELLQGEILHSPVPDVHGSVGLGLLGNVDYVLSDVRVTSCSLPQVSASFCQEGAGLKAAVSHVRVLATGSWQTHYGLIHDGGTFDLAITDLGMSAVLRLGRDSAGHLSISSALCSANVGDVGINFHGGGSIVFQPFVDLFHGQIRAMVTSKICPVAEVFIAKANAHLAGQSVFLRVNKDLLLDMSLVSSPVVTASSLGLDFKGECHTIQHPTEPPFQAKPFELTQHENDMLSAGLSEFSVNSAFYAYFSAGLLQVHIDNRMIPPGSPFHLNTSSFGLLIPMLPKLFPNMLMELGVSASEVPMVSFVPGAVKMKLLAQVATFAAYPNKTLAPLFKVSIHSSLEIKLGISQLRLFGSATMSNLTLTLVSSEIGEFPTAALENAVNIVMKLGVLAKLNLQMAKGINLPAPLFNPVLSVEKGYLSFLSDLH